MYNPFPPPSSTVVRLVTPLAEYLHLPLLPSHIHEVVISLATYQLIYKFIGPKLSARVFPKAYTSLSPKDKSEWDLELVAFTNCILLSILSTIVVLFDDVLANMTWQERVWETTEICNFTLAIANGYFIWHLIMMIIHVKTYGWPMLAHGVATFAIMLNGFRPAFNWYAPRAYLYEYSNILLDINRYLVLLGMSGSKAQVINGVFLLVVFFFCRVVWGTCLTAWFLGDIWAAYTTNMTPQGMQRQPTWLLLTHALCSSTLQSLNYFWFWKIAKLVKRKIGSIQNKDKNRHVVKME